MKSGVSFLDKKVGNQQKPALETSVFFFFFFFLSIHFVVINVYWLYIVCGIFNGIIFSLQELFQVAVTDFITGIVVMHRVLVQLV